MQKILEQTIQLMENQHFDGIAVGVIDFSKKSYQSFEITNYSVVSKKPYHYFDLASLTKPLTLASTFLYHPELFSDDLILLLDHEAGLPSGGRLSRDSWKEQILSYQIRKSPTLYSDYSALRLMLELEKKSGKKLRELASHFWDPELLFWKDLPPSAYSFMSGVRGGRPIIGVVHDDNAYVINQFTSHAGLFATIDGLMRSILKLDLEVHLVDKMTKALKDSPLQKRFVYGWDRVQNVKETLAGGSASLNTFGHTGFTGTSLWIDTEKKRGSVILTNATQNYWYERSGLSEIRKKIGEAIFSNQ